MNGLNLTRFTPKHRYYPGKDDLPRDLEHPVAQGSISVVRRNGRQVTLDPPIHYKVWRVIKSEYSGIVYAYQAESVDLRLGDLPRWTVYHSGEEPRACTSKGDATEIISGAISSFRIRASKHVTSFGFKSDTITVEEYEVKPSVSREGIADAMGLALRVFHLEGKTEAWGLHYGEVAVGGRFIDMVHACHINNIHAFEFKSCRADFTADKKWRDYLRFCHRLTFVTTPGSIREDELPEEVGLYYLNRHYRPVGDIRRTKGEMALTVVRAAKQREIEEKHLHEIVSRLLTSRGVPPAQGQIDEALYKALARVYGEPEEQDQNIGD